ncbi:hypothetical protein HN51_022146 [Arachis hypogaea]|uniref:Chromosome transmission fidelity protein 18 homolog n=2 Tax=Arachis TaxID=3817 RepID=A0A445EEQ0_ARAHY|nr:uncharacterized protein LOC107474482 [Arachis duranensis]XP_025649223.1 chromosome transmission fidelity protein 18 homolog [Arachis hypogaea]RYR73917.1 hypothetical protein Ahy_A02g008494 [Arachis hypogaea]
MMNMDMDMPLPEELELLELERDYPDFDIPEPEQEQELQPQKQPQTHPQPESPDLVVLPEPQSNGHKRSRSDDPSPVRSLSEEKRVRVGDSAASEVDAVSNDDEDWLQYSPPPRGVRMEEEDRFVKEKELSRYAWEIHGECMPVTAPSGDRVYAKLNRIEGLELARKLDWRANSADLTLEPINALFERLEQEAIAKTMEASLEGQSYLDVPATQMVHEQLWVDKYAPKSFTELLSDEQTNREVLLWLKQWDSVVFGSDIRSTSDDVLFALKRHSSVAQNQRPFNSKFSRRNRGAKWSSGRYKNSRSMDGSSNSQSIEDILNTRTTNVGPPEQKILLLCGSPGLGKTTIAHVAARHCGYHVVEVNASDDRSTSTIESKILDVVQMNSVLSDSRPKCLVVDEIDGALGEGKGAVEVLLKMVSAETKSDAGRKSSKKGWKRATLSRPVICICNDLYAPALRPLRQIAKVHMFVQPTVGRVVSRLKHICNKEGMKASAIALTALANYTECDIRSCLNTLQFLSKKKETLNMFDLASQVVGQKDMSKNVIDIWKEIFHRKRKKLERNSPKSKSFEFDSLYSLISNRGDSDLISDGIHENILLLNYHDPVMQKTVKCFDILGVFDVLHKFIWRTQQMPLHVYLPPIAIGVHHIVAQVQKPSIEWPKSYQRYRTMMSEKIDILNTWHYKVPPHIARHLSVSCIVEDIISPLLHILSPPTIRPVALHLLAEKEKNDFSQLVSTMVSYSITYKTTKSEMQPNHLSHEVANDMAVSLVPPINDFINFKDYASNHHTLSLPMKKVLLHEVEKQRILQVTKGDEVFATGTINAQSTKANHGAAADKKTTETNTNILARQLNANPKSDSPNSNLNKVPCDLDNAKLPNTGNKKRPSNGFSSFFDRFKKPGEKGLKSNDGSLQKEETLKKDPFPLLFKFNEGFTNAVKRPVRIREFLC